MNKEAITKINTALEHATEEERYTLTKDLLELWFKGDKKLAEKVFGNFYGVHQDAPIVATVTGNWRELRFWIGQPGIVRDNHCDAGGETILAEVVNHQKDIDTRYFDIALKMIGNPVGLMHQGMVFATGKEFNRPKSWGMSWNTAGGEIDYHKEE